MIDAKHGSALSHRHTQAADLRRKYRAATLDITTSAVKPWKFGTLARMALTRILELFHTIGNVIEYAQNAEVVGVVRCTSKDIRHLPPNTFRMLAGNQHGTHP